MYFPNSTHRDVGFRISLVGKKSDSLAGVSHKTCCLVKGLVQVELEPVILVVPA